MLVSEDTREVIGMFKWAKWRSRGTEGSSADPAEPDRDSGEEEYESEEEDAREISSPGLPRIKTDDI
jgi:hypothetical protein